MNTQSITVRGFALLGSSVLTILLLMIVGAPPTRASAAVTQVAQGLATPDGQASLRLAQTKCGSACAAPTSLHALARA